jgi:L-ascorbate metabolism protein UlaG (beta-lactamase superfamily)
LLQLDGINILTDPIWSDRASPYTFIGPQRLAPPGLKFSDLPNIDVVLLSHDHYDHLDKATIVKLGHRPLYLVSLGVGRILRDMGINNYHEFDWGDNFSFRGIDFICAPAQHFSGRTVFNHNRTLWLSWVIKGKERSFYFGGDSGYAPFYRELGHKYGPFDAAAMPIGPVEPRDFMRPVHLDPADAIQAYLELRAKIFIPIHWGTFPLGMDPVGLPPRKLMEEVKKRSLPAENIWIPKLGETRWL